MSSRYIKKEPGVDDSPPRSWSYLRRGRGNEPDRRSRRSASSPRARSPVPTQSIIHQQQKSNKQLAIDAAIRNDVWKYISSLKPGLFLAKTVASGKTLEMLQLPRKRELPSAWRQRIALEGLAPGNVRIVVGYLVGEETPGRMCNASAANCASHFQSVHPAMMAFDNNDPAIYKAAAFPRCVLFPVTSNDQGAKRICVNGVYRESKAATMPTTWRPNEARAPLTAALPVAPPVVALQPEHVVPAEAPMSAWEEWRQLLYVHGPDNTPLGYAHSMGFMHDRINQAMPTGVNGTNMQLLNIDNADPFATTLLPSQTQSLICFVLEGTLEVNISGIPVFTINMHSQFAVRAGQTCHVRNLGGSRTVLYAIGVSYSLQQV